MAVLENQLKEWLESGDVDHIQDIHPEFYDYLLREQFIVDNEANEAEEVIKKWKEEEEKDDCLSLMVNSTLDCNVRCWYCYEKHRANTDLTPETVASMLKLIRKRITGPKLKSVHISFFGGEPLLNFEKTVFPLLVQIDEMCHAEGKLFVVSFVSNSYLLSDEVVDKVRSLHLANPMTVQITLDGNEEIHNKTRHLASEEGTYAKILSNIRMAINKDVQITLRFNCTGNNVRTFVDVLSDIKNGSTEEKNKIRIDLQQVWQDSLRTDVDMQIEFKKIRELFMKEGFYVSEAKVINPSRCYGDNANHFIVNYNGDLYKCSARDFTQVNREGVLTSDGNLEWNEKRTLREKIKYGNTTCQTCRIYPLCHGGCSQGKLEQQGVNGCIKYYTELNKVKIVRDRVEFLLERFV
ncbi:MAG: radical SAM protein [Paraprevotella sp.]|nr:radical SAM protein [Paraprevotella sp.]